MKNIYIGKDKDYGTLSDFMSRLADINGDITVFLDGEYCIDDSLKFTPNNIRDRRIIFNGSDATVISGGVKVEGWQKLPDSDIWAAKAPVEKIRRLYVNGKTMQRSKTKYKLKGDYEAMNWGIIRVLSDMLPKIETPADNIEAVWEKAVWRHFRHGIEAITEDHREKDRWFYMIQLKQPYYAWGLELSGPFIPFHEPTPANPFHLENALEFLTDEGEWCYEKHSGMLYYKPFADEDISKLDIVVAKAEKLVEIRGESIGKKAKNIEFNNISFKYCAWNRVTDKGFATIQAQLLNAEDKRQNYSKKELVEGAVELDFADGISFNNCSFSLLGGDGLKMINGVTNVSVRNCRFEDISSGAIVVGIPEHQMIPEMAENVCTNINIESNYITRVAKEYYSSPAVTLFYVAKSHIHKNEIFDLPYSGISLGWGWRTPAEKVVCVDNVIEYNCIHDFMKVLIDGGGVYTLGFQKNTKIRYNYIHTMGYDHAAIYTDNGSQNIEIYGNVLQDVIRFGIFYDKRNDNINVHDNYTNTFCTIFNPIQSEMKNNYYFQQDLMCDEACDIIAKCGTGHHYPKLGRKGIRFETYFHLEETNLFEGLTTVKGCGRNGLHLFFDKPVEIKKLLFDLNEYIYDKTRIVEAFRIENGELTKLGTNHCPENAGYVVFSEAHILNDIFITCEVENNTANMPFRNVFFIK